MFGGLKRKIAYDFRQLHYIRIADKINCFEDVPAIEHSVNIYDYQPMKYGYEMPQGSPYNLGDYLGRVIIKFLLDEKGIDINQSVSEKKHLFAVGSNILGSDNKGNYQNATIWGSGCLLEPSRRAAFFQKLSRRRLDIRAVRGPLTRDVLIKLGHNCPEVYGDPAILMPLFYRPQNLIKKYEFTVIPQFYNERLFREGHPGLPILSMNTNEYKTVIDRIVASGIVYTSSLHGIILAESYGVPSVFFRGLAKSIDFKYKDYYYSTGRYDVPLVDTYEDAQNIVPPPLPELDGLRK